MRYLAVLIICMFSFLGSCQTLQKESDVLEAPTHPEGLGKSNVSEASRCIANGGELISGFCVCSDGVDVKGKTCAQHVKENYSKCYSKGGVTKKWDGKNVCMCEHGEIISEDSPKSCYQLFSDKNKGCSSRLGIQTFDDHACRCYHGKLLIDLKPGMNCRDDFKALDPECYSKGGVTKSANGPCECRDGSYVEGEKTKCSENWFFYPVAENQPPQDAQGAGSGEPQNGTGGGGTEGDTQQNTRPDSNGTNNIGGELPACICTHVNHRGRDYCMIYTPGDKYPHEYTPDISPRNCTINHCFTHFNRSYDAKCEGNVKFRPSKESASGGGANSKACYCNVATLYNVRACGLFVGTSSRASFAIQTFHNEVCDENFCRNRWGHEPYVREKCSQITNGQRIQ